MTLHLLTPIIANPIFVSATQSGKYAHLFNIAGFSWNSTTKTYHANVNAWQQIGGYNDLYDVVFDYATDMNVALQALSSVPELCPSVLKEPAPAVWYNGFGESGINIVLAVWFNSSDLVKMKNEVYIAIKKVFDEKGINIPFNRLDVSMVEA